MRSEITATAAFCDDIRQEISGKYSLIGCYCAQMLVDDFPATLPRLCIAVYIKIHPGAAVENITLYATLGADAQIGKYVLPNVSQTVEQLRSNGITGIDGCATLAAMLAFSPLILTEPTKLKISADVDGKQIFVESLNIMKMA